MKYVPSLDKNFSPIILKIREFNELVKKASEVSHLTICLERNQGYNYFYEIDIFADGTGHDEENYELVERIVKSLLWIVGGYKVYVAGSKYIYEKLKEAYSENGARAFDADFMGNVYENDFVVVECKKEELPEPKSEKVELNSNLNGCRIGFDAGGSDRKVSAVVDGEVLYSEETVWYPKINSDPEYQSRCYGTARFDTCCEILC